MSGSARRKTDAGFPDDLVMELLIRLPGKQVGRCKCVCKSWRSVIRSAHFKDAYGTRHRGLIPYRREPNSGKALNVYYSPISDKQEELEFSHLNKLSLKYAGINRIMYMCNSLTRMVNGLICADYADLGWLSIYNVCTGESMRVPDELPDEDERPVFMSGSGKKTRPQFHLGFDAARRTYKLLRLKHYGNLHPDNAHIMTLRPSSSSSSEWEPIKFGVGDYIPRVSEISRPSERKITPNDGFVCWCLPGGNDLILFDFNKDKFHKISIPFSSGEWFVRAQFMERLAVSLWSICRTYSARRPVCKLRCFVMEDAGGKSWSQYHIIDLPQQLDKEVFAVPNGSLSATSGTEMVVINTTENEVYCYEHTSKTKEAQFRVGKQPDYPMTTYGLLPPPGHPFYTAYTSTLSCLCDANHLYLPLDDILSASK